MKIIDIYSLLALSVLVGIFFLSVNVKSKYLGGVVGFIVVMSFVFVMDYLQAAELTIPALILIFGCLMTKSKKPINYFSIFLSSLIFLYSISSFYQLKNSVLLCFSLMILIAANFFMDLARKRMGVFLAASGMCAVILIFLDNELIRWFLLLAWLAFMYIYFYRFKASPERLSKSMNKKFNKLFNRRRKQ